MNTQLVLNVSPVIFEDADVDVEVLPYKSKEQFDSLRHKWRRTHFLRRSGGDQIVCVPLLRDAPEIGGQRSRISLREEPYLTSALVREALVSFCHRQNRPTPKYSPIIIPTKEQSFLVGTVSGITCPPWLVVNTKFVVATRVVKYGDGLAVPVVAIDVETQRKIDLKADELLALGLDLTGLYVGKAEAQPDDRLAPRFTVLGKVHSVDHASGRILLTDAKDDLESIEISDAVLEPSKASFNRCIEHVFGSHAGQAKGGLDARLSKERRGEERLRKLEGTRSSLNKKELELVPGVAFALGPFLSQERGDLPEPKVRLRRGRPESRHLA
jgi:hypothetical protein